MSSKYLKIQGAPDHAALSPIGWSNQPGLCTAGVEDEAAAAAAAAATTAAAVQMNAMR